MVFPSRMVLASSALGILAASSGAVLTLTTDSATAAVQVPVFDHSAVPSVPTGVAEPLTAAPPVTGAQIADLAVAPARARVTAIITERARAAAESAARAERQAAAQAAATRAEAARQAAPEPAPEPEPEPSSRNEDFRRMAEQIHQACDDGRLRGRICGDT